MVVAAARVSRESNVDLHDQERVRSFTNAVWLPYILNNGPFAPFLTRVTTTGLERRSRLCRLACEYPKGGKVSLSWQSRLNVNGSNGNLPTVGQPCTNRSKYTLRDKVRKKPEYHELSRSRYIPHGTHPVPGSITCDIYLP